MRILFAILVLFIVGPLFAGELDNPYLNRYSGLAKYGQRGLISNPYMEYYNNMNELKQKYKQAKDREKSTANKILGAAAIGATGIGAMQLLSGLAEQAADDAAERDMRAYLATFTCDYGAGRNVRGGETNIVLPNFGDMLPMVTEYKQLAADLKSRKDALGMLPGIEAELLLDASDSGLYDNVSLGKADGAFTSLSRVLSDPDSEDTKKWQEQKNATAKKVKTGAIVSSAGVAVGVVGNMLINNGKSDEKIKSQAENTTQFSQSVHSLSHLSNTGTTLSTDDSTNNE